MVIVISNRGGKKLSTVLIILKKLTHKLCKRIYGYFKNIAKSIRIF